MAYREDFTKIHLGSPWPFQGPISISSGLLAIQCFHIESQFSPIRFSQRHTEHLVKTKGAHLEWRTEIRSGREQSKEPDCKL